MAHPLAEDIERHGRRRRRDTRLNRQRGRIDDNHDSVPQTRPNKGRSNQLLKTGDSCLRAVLGEPAEAVPPGGGLLLPLGEVTHVE
jgi:hypothetical protein